MRQETACSSSSRVKRPCGAQRGRLALRVPQKSTEHLNRFSVYRRSGEHQSDPLATGESGGNPEETRVRGGVADAFSGVGVPSLPVLRRARPAAGIFLPEGPAGFRAGRGIASPTGLKPSRGREEPNVVLALMVAFLVIMLLELEERFP